jgi:hypothetical protein
MGQIVSQHTRNVKRASICYISYIIGWRAILV